MIHEVSWRDSLDVFTASTGESDVAGRAVEEANAKAVLETGDGVANRCRRHIQIDGRRTEASEPGDGDHGLEFHQPGFVHCHDSQDTASPFISIIATIKVRYGCNDHQRHKGGWNAQSPYHQHHLRHHDARLPRIRSPGS